MNRTNKKAYKVQRMIVTPVELPRLRYVAATTQHKLFNSTAHQLLSKMIVNLCNVHSHSQKWLFSYFAQKSRSCNKVGGAADAIKKTDNVLFAFVWRIFYFYYCYTQFCSGIVCNEEDLPECNCHNDNKFRYDCISVSMILGVCRFHISPFSFLRVYFSICHLLYLLPLAVSLLLLYPLM